MANENFDLDGEYQDKFQAKVLKTVEAFGEGGSSKKQKNFLSLLLVIAVAVAGIAFYKNSEKTQVALQGEEFGLGMSLYNSGKFAEAKSPFETFLSRSDVQPELRAKAALFLGEILYYDRNLAEASVRYGEALANAGDMLLVKAAAQSGLASVLVQEKKYEEAAVALETFVKAYSKRTADYKVWEKGTEDLVVSIPDALFQLALVYKELGKKEQAIEVSERLYKRYPDSRKVNDAKKLIVSL